MKKFASHNMATHKQVIVWLLMLSFLSLMLFPNHYHIYHDSSSTIADIEAHDHEVGFHDSVDLVHADHHQDSHIVDLSTDITFKSTNIKLPLFVLILSLVLLLPLYSGALSQLRLVSSNHKPSGLYRFSIPPLRAPPLG